MPLLVTNPEDRFSHVEAQYRNGNLGILGKEIYRKDKKYRGWKYKRLGWKGNKNGDAA